MSDAGAVRLATTWLDAPATRAVTGLLTGGGHAALFVGGCVRDALLGRAVADIDIATDALPRRVLDLAAGAGMKAVPTGIDHGTVTLVSGGRPFEVTTFRRDVATDGRRATVAFASDVAADAARRDFTMNALYADGSGRVLDPTGEGLGDLAARRIRFVGEPAQRIAEDYLRILRFFRFHAWFGDPAAGPDPAALAACAAGRDGLARLSRERVGAEVTRLLDAPDPASSLADMAGVGLLEPVLPGADATGVAALVASERQAGVPADWPRRLAALGSGADWPKRLRLSRATMRRLAAIAAARRDAAAGLGPAALAWRHGAEAALDALLLGAAAAGERLPPAAVQEVARGAGARFPVRAADLALAGPELGRALKRLEAAWLAADLRPDRDALLALDTNGDS